MCFMPLAQSKIISRFCLQCNSCKNVSSSKQFRFELLMDGLILAVNLNDARGSKYVVIFQKHGCNSGLGAFSIVNFRVSKGGMAITGVFVGRGWHCQPWQRHNLISSGHLSFREESLKRPRTANPMCFGVQIHARLQVFGLGSANCSQLVSKLLVHQLAAFYLPGPVLLEVSCSQEMLEELPITPSLRSSGRFFRNNHSPTHSDTEWWKSCLLPLWFEVSSLRALYPTHCWIQLIVPTVKQFQSKYRGTALSEQDLIYRPNQHRTLQERRQCNGKAGNRRSRKRRSNTTRRWPTGRTWIIT